MWKERKARAQNSVGRERETGTSLGIQRICLSPLCHVASLCCHCSSLRHLLQRFQLSHLFSLSVVALALRVYYDCISICQCLSQTKRMLNKAKWPSRLEICSASKHHCKSEHRSLKSTCDCTNGRKANQRSSEKTMLYKCSAGDTPTDVITQTNEES